MYSVRGGGASPGGCRRVRLWWVKHRWGLVVLVVLVGGTGNAGGTGGGVEAQLREQQRKAAIHGEGVDGADAQQCRGGDAEGGETRLLG